MSKNKPNINTLLFKQYDCVLYTQSYKKYNDVMSMNKSKIFKAFRHHSCIQHSTFIAYDVLRTQIHPNIIVIIAKLIGINNAIIVQSE